MFYCTAILFLIESVSSIVYRITRMFCEHQTFARVDQFTTIKSAKPKLLLVNTHDPFQNAIVRSQRVMIWLIRKGFSLAKYSIVIVSHTNRKEKVFILII